MARYLVQMPEELDLNGDGRVTVGELVVSALVLAVSIVGGLGVLVTCLWLFFRPETPGPVRLGSGIVGLAVLVAAVLLAWRMTRYERVERLTAEEIRRRRSFEDDDRAVRNGLQGQDEAARISQADVDHAVWRILQEYYAGRDWARGKIQGISEPRWNLANEALQKSELRNGRKTKLNAETLDQAWSAYLLWRASRRSHYVTSEGDLIAK